MNDLRCTRVPPGDSGGDAKCAASLLGVCRSAAMDDARENDGVTGVGLGLPSATLLLLPVNLRSTCGLKSLLGSDRMVFSVTMSGDGRLTGTTTCTGVMVLPVAM